MASTPDPADPLLAGLSAVSTSSKAMETVTLAGLITLMELIRCPHESRGETEYNRMETYEKALIALEPKLVCRKIKQITAAL